MQTCREQDKAMGLRQVGGRRRRLQGRPPVSREKRAPSCPVLYTLPSAPAPLSRSHECMDGWIRRVITHQRFRLDKQKQSERGWEPGTGNRVAHQSLPFPSTGTEFRACTSSEPAIGLVRTIGVFGCSC
jgi:hypothetical protein